MTVIRALKLAQTLSKLSGPSHFRERDVKAPMQAVRPGSLPQTGKPVSYRGTTTSSTGSRRPSQLFQYLRRAIPPPARPILAFF